MDDKSIDAVFGFWGYDADDNRNRRDSGVSRGDGCELERSAASGDERNRPQRRQTDIVDNCCAKRYNPLLKGLSSFA
jgi:hypothetical protein